MSPRKRKQIDSLEQAIETALSPGSFISYKAAWSFVDDVQDVANDIGKIIKKEPERAAHLYETFIAACHEKANEIDDSSVNFGMLVGDLFRGWIKARQAANDNPYETAKSLLYWMEDDPYGFCHDLDREVVKALDNMDHAKKCYAKAGLNADWQAVVADVRERHFRKKGFMGGFEDIVSGASKYVEPPFSVIFPDSINPLGIGSQHFQGSTFKKL